MASTTRSAPETKYEKDDARANTYNTSKANTAGFSETPSSGSPFLTSSSAEKSNHEAAPSDAMLRWLDQKPKDEPWYGGGRLASDTVEDGRAKMKK